MLNKSISRIFCLVLISFLIFTPSAKAYTHSYETLDIQAVKESIHSDKIWTNITIQSKSYDPYYDHHQTTFCEQALIFRNEKDNSINQVLCIGKKNVVIEFFGHMIKHIRYY